MERCTYTQSDFLRMSCCSSFDSDSGACTCGISPLVIPLVSLLVAPLIVPLVVPLQRPLGIPLVNPLASRPLTLTLDELLVTVDGDFLLSTLSGIILAD
jgi:hypothetical protein